MLQFFEALSAVIEPCVLARGAGTPSPSEQTRFHIFLPFLSAVGRSVANLSRSGQRRQDKGESYENPDQ